MTPEQLADKHNRLLDDLGQKIAEIQSVRRENEILRGQINAARILSTEAWETVNKLSQPLTEKEIAAHSLQGYELEFVELMRERRA